MTEIQHACINDANRPLFKKIETQDVMQFQLGIGQLEQWGLQYLLSLFQEKGFFQSNADIHDLSEIQDRLNAHSKYNFIIESVMELFCEHGYLNKLHEGIYESKSKPNTFLTDNALKRIVDLYPSVALNAEFLLSVLDSFFDVLSGKENFLKIMFPDGKLKVIEQLYKQNPDSIYFNKIVTQLIKNYVSENDTTTQKHSIIEIGAGIGSTSEYLLPMLHKGGFCEQYVYTDITKAFTNYAEKKFDFDFLSFKALDIQQNPTSQGFNTSAFDIVIATNVLHVTKNISQALINIRSLLKPNGILVINEGVVKGGFATLVYGLTDGWWAFEDHEWRIPGSPFINVENWKKLLHEAGFVSVISLNEHIKPGINIIQDVFLAE